VIPTFSHKILLTGCVGTGLLAAGAFGTIGAIDSDVDPPAFAAVSAPICTRPRGLDPAASWFVKLAAAKSETGPFQPLPDSGSQARTGLEEPPLLSGLGRLSYPITTSKRLAQQYFDQGVRLALAFNHAEARRAFRRAGEIDPHCAMCFWGEALTLGPNINAPMDPAAVEPAVGAVSRAMQLSARATVRERALIAALATRYSDDPGADRAALDAAYAKSMRKVAARYPKDQLAAVLFAESLMDLTPWDYWEAGGARPKGHTAEIVATLDRVLKANPDHPGAIHYYIHVVEASSAPERAEPYARRLAATMPGAGHLVHMPFHIYFRIGDYASAIAANKAAVEADEAYIARVAPLGIYPQAYYPHNVHSLMVSAQMAGEGRTVIESADKLERIVSSQAAAAIPWVQPIKAAPYFAHAQFSEASTILALPDPGDALPYVKGMWHYARGVALAANGDAPAAAAQSRAIANIRETVDLAALEAGGVPARDLLRVAQHVVDARIAQARGDLAASAAEFEQAVTVEDGLAYSEPPFWYYPVRQSLGAARTRIGDLDGAEAAFRASLVRAPNNGWALYGLAQVYRKRGDTRTAAALDKRLRRAWVGDTSQLDLARL
jgi:tetratricopeptide (TPR) repeat protein